MKLSQRLKRIEQERNDELTKRINKYTIAKFKMYDHMLRTICELILESPDHPDIDTHNGVFHIVFQKGTPDGIYERLFTPPIQYNTEMYISEDLDLEKELLQGQPKPSVYKFLRYFQSAKYKFIPYFGDKLFEKIFTDIKDCLSNEGVENVVLDALSTDSFTIEIITK